MVTLGYLREEENSPDQTRVAEDNLETMTEAVREHWFEKEVLGELA